jgi:hypothetical protein
MKLINTLFGRNAELKNVKAGGAFTCHWAFSSPDYFGNVTKFRYLRTVE